MDAGDPTSPARADVLVKLLPDLCRFVRANAGSRLRRLDSTGDLVQTICRQVLTELAAVAPDDDVAFRAWVFRTAWRKILKRARHHRAARRDHTLVGPLSTEGSQVPAADSCSPSEAAWASEMSTALHAALGRLRASDRELVTLVRIANIPMAEVAHAEGVAVGAIRVRLHRALARLAAVLPDDVAGSVSAAATVRVSRAGHRTP